MAILSNHSAAQWVAAIAAIGAVAAAGWWPLGRWRSKTERDLELARQKFDAGNWPDALQLVQKHRPADAAPPAPWHEARRLLEGECLVAASEAALRERRFADALTQYRAAGAALGLTENEAANRIVEAMLAELRRLSADEPESPALPELASRIVDQKSATGEAEFWRGLYHLRRGDPAAATADLTYAYAHSHASRIDPVLYLGALRLQAGSPREALRFLVEANKLAPQCPLVAWQLGTALIATGGDALLAVRALQKAVGPDGLLRFLAEPARIWIDTLPRDSWIRNLVRRTGSQRTRFACPLGLDRLKDVIESARLTLAEALIDCRRPGEATTLFMELLRTRDDLAVHRGLGLALTELGCYDDALLHLQRAWLHENPPSSRTIGALARSLSQAAGDRIGNLQQAVSLLGSPPVRVDAEWARHAGAVIAAAQSAGVAVPPNLIIELAHALIAADAADRSAAVVYDLLALRDPHYVPIEAAWLYVRAAERENVALSNDDVLFDRAFADRAGMGRFFDAREWDFAAAERLYLHRWTERTATDDSPAGPRQRAMAEANLLAEAERHLAQSRLDAAQSSIELAQKLTPNSLRVHDLLAELAYRRGEFDASIDWLQRWSRLDPEDPLPMVRMALIYRRQGRLEEARPLLAGALSMARGTTRAPIALLAARLAVASGQWREALEFVRETLTFDSQNAVGLAARAALLVELGESSQLAGVVAPLANLKVEDVRTHHLIGVSAYWAGDDELASERAEICIADKETAAQGHYLCAALQLREHRETDAIAELQAAVDRASGPTEESVRVLLGQLAWRAGLYAEALRAWRPIPAARLKFRGLEALIPGTAFLAGLAAAGSHQLDDAAKWWRAAARLGFSHLQLDPLLANAVEYTDPKPSASRLEQARDAAGLRPEIVRRLAQCYRRLGRMKDAEALLDSILQPEAALLVERGLLHLASHQLVSAEHAFAEALALDPVHEATAVNLLLCRLSLGRWEDAKAVLPQATKLASTRPNERLCRSLADLMADPPRTNSGWTFDDDDTVILLCRSLARLDTAGSLLTALAAARIANPKVQRTHEELLPLVAKQLLDRGDAAGVLRRFGPAAATAPRVMRNLLGVAAALRQDFESAGRHFQAALPADGADARVQQNLAIIRGWQGRNAEAVEHWRRFLGLLKQLPRPKDLRKYFRRITTLVHSRLQSLE